MEIFILFMYKILQSGNICLKLLKIYKLKCNKKKTFNERILLLEIV